MLFPLPLAPFEEYMLVDDRPAYPMNFFLRLRFEGLFNPALLEEACGQSVARHPLLSAHLQPARGGRFQWVQPSHRSCPLRWRTTAGGEEPIGAIDLQREPGLRVWATAEKDGTELLLQFHHSCCDAVGACQFVEDLLVCYAGLQGGAGSPADLRPVDAAGLLSRESYGAPGWQLTRLFGQQSLGLRRARKFFMRNAVPLKPGVERVAEDSLPDDFPSSCVHEFDQPQTAGLLAAARAAGTTVNNLLLRDLFLALEAFRARREMSCGEDWLRLAVPVNMRLRGDERLPTANLVSMVFLDRQSRECADPAALLLSLHDEMQLVKQRRLGLTFLLALRYNRKLPGAIARLRRRTQRALCQGTAVISNLVSPWENSSLRRPDGQIVAGDVLLRRVDFLPPLRPYTAAAVGVVTCAQRLCLALHYDSRVLNREEAAELLENLVRGMQRSQAPV